MIQLKSTDSLQVLLAGAITTSQGVLYATFADIAADGSTFAPAPSSGATNSTTAVDWVAAPASGVRVVKYLSLYNADTVDMTATVRVVDNGTNRILDKFTLAAGESLKYIAERGFVTTSAGGSSGVTSVNGDTGPAVVIPVFVNVMMSDMTTDITTGTAKAVWFAPEDGDLTDVWIGLHDPSSSGDVRIDMNDSGGSVFTTRPLIQATEETSLTGTAAVLDGTVSFVKGAKFTFDIDDAGTDAKGLQAVVEYTPT